MKRTRERQQVGPMPAGEKLAVGAVFVLVAWPAWLRGGTVPWLMVPLPIVALGLLVAWILIPEKFRGAALSGLFKDPLFAIGLGFLGLLALQWLNAGRTLAYDEEALRWFYTEPRWSGWPSAIAKSDAREMWTWFLPAVVLLWLVRSGIRSRQGMDLVLVLLVANAGVLAAFGVAQYAAGSDALFGIFPARAHFFASFGYANHAGEFFVLMFALSSGLALARASDGPRVWMFGLVALLSLVAVHLSLSRAAMLLVWLLAVFAFRELYVRAGDRLSPSARLNLLLGVVAVAGIAFYMVAGLMGDKVSASLAGVSVPGLARALGGGRWDQFMSALRIWMDYPAFGAGGWCYSYLAALYIPPDAWARITFNGEDANLTANVHNDLAQFLGEFGLAGLGLMLAGLFVVVRPLLRRGHRFSASTLIVVVGLVAIVMQSMIDLPFRCPAVMYSWLVVLVVTARLADESGPWHRRGTGSL